jgi:hypothetical protein
MRKLTVLFLAVVTVLTFSGLSFGEVYDNFNGNVIDGDKWFVIDPANVISQNDGLIMKWNGIRDSGLLGSEMTFEANQDFEVSASWSKFAVDGTRNNYVAPPPAMGFQIGAVGTGGDYVFLEQKFENNEAEFLSLNNHGVSNVIQTANPDPYNTGTFTIKRQGSTVSTYWNDNLVQSYPDSITGEVRFLLSGYSGSQDYQLDGKWSSVSYKVTPEPASMLLFGLGGASLVLFRKSKRKKITA